MLSPLSVRIAEVLAQSLPGALDTLSTQRYGGPLPGQLPDASPPVGYRLTPPDLPPLEATFTIRHVGGNVYDVEARVDGRAVQSFCYCLPEPAPLLVPSSPRLARDVAAFLLDELERQLGRDLLRRALDPAPAGRAASPASPTAPSAL